MQQATFTTDQLADNIAAVLDQATPADVAEGSSWYATAHALALGLAAEHQTTVETAAGVIAALSPRVSWTCNERFAQQLLATGDAPVLFGNKRKALAIRAGESPLAVLGGNKVRAFYACILAPGTTAAVCIDRHAFDVAHGRVTADTTRKQLDRSGEYDRISAAYRIVAERTSLRPHQVQAITWVAWRRLKKGN